MVLAVDGKVYIYDSNDSEYNLLLREICGKEITHKFDRMIKAFGCDFSLIQDGKRTFSELDDIYKQKIYLKKDMELMQELSYLLRHGKACIVVMEGAENE